MATPTDDEHIVLFREAKPEQFRLSRERPLAFDNVTTKSTFLHVKGAPLIQLLSVAGDIGAMMRCAYASKIRDIPRTNKQCSEVSLVLEDEEAASFFHLLDAHIKRELLTVTDFTPEQVEASYMPIYQRKDDLLPGHISATLDPPFGLQSTSVYPVVEWGDGVLRHTEASTMSLAEKVKLFKKDAQVAVAVIRFGGFSIKLDKHGETRIYPNVSLARVAVYTPQDADPFA
jgi:hypothetical protein